MPNELKLTAPSGDGWCMNPHTYPFSHHLHLSFSTQAHRHMDSTLQLQHRGWLHAQQLIHRHSSPSDLSSSPSSNSSSASSSSSSSSPPPPHAQSFPPWLAAGNFPPPTVDPWSPFPSAEPPFFKFEPVSISESWPEYGAFPTTSSCSSVSSSPSDTSSLGASSSPYRGPSSASSDPWMPGNQLAHSESASLDATVDVHAASFADDVLMDPVLEFISDMITHENMEHQKCMQQECLSYQATVNGISGDDSCLPSSCCTEGQKLKLSGTSMAEVRDVFADRVVEEEDYRWIENVLVADLHAEGDITNEQAWTSDAVLNNTEQENALRTWPTLQDSASFSGSDRDLKVLSFDSSSSYSPFSEGSPTSLHENGFSASHAVVTLPSVNNVSVAPSLTSTPPFFDFHLPNGMMPSNGLLVPGDSHPLQSQFLPHSLKSMQTCGFSFDVEGDKPSPLHEKQDVSEKNGPIEQAKLAGPEGAPDEQPISFVRNEYLNAEKHAKMYGDWWPAQDALVAKKKQASGKRKGKPEPVDLRSLLVDCAQAVGVNNLKKANEIVQDLRQHVSPFGSASQRLAYYFTEGLVARLAGTGAQQYTAMSNNRPSAANMLKAFRVILEVCPFAKMAHFFANQNILKVSEGAAQVHIVDYGILYGVQWPALISALAERKGGPPFLRITGIEFPQPGRNPSERLEETGRRLAEYAKTYNVPFEYQAIAKQWEDVGPADLNLQEGEILAVNCVQRLRHLMDETVVSASPRRKVLSRMHSLNPDIVLLVIQNAGYNAPFFVSRFREVLYHYSSQFDMIETTVADSENPQRQMLEREVLGRDILNVVACEGHERVERPETYRQWQGRFQRAGFKPLTLDHTVLKKAKDVVKAFYHKDFSVDDDSKWMLLGWKGRIMQGLSAWKPVASALVI